MRLKILTMLLLLFIILCGEIFADQQSQPLVRLHGSSIIYEGVVNEEGFIKLQNAMQKRKSKIKWLDISSTGGEINISMDIGLWVHNNGLNVRVRNECLSSCANYIFPAGKNKVLENGSIVAWHGSAIQGSLANLTDEEMNNALATIEDPAEREIQKEQMIKQYNDYLNKMKDKQESFFNLIGVDQSITVIGQQKKYNVNGFWALSVKDMAKFGITNVKAQDNYPKKVAKKYSELTHLIIEE